MKTLYPWHQLAWDISFAGCPALNLDEFKQKIADEFNRDIQLGRTPCWTEAGEPIRGGVPFENQRRRVPHITVESANAWLKENQYLETWEPVVAPPIQRPTKLDESTLATPAELIDAFEKWGLKRDWFKDLNSRKWLLNARKKIGKGQRRRSIQPLFCPHEVMQGLMHRVRNPKRLSVETGWRTLEHKFPSVYNKYHFNDPRDRQGD